VYFEEETDVLSITPPNRADIQTMMINEPNKRKHASNKYRVINFIILHKQVQKKDVIEMRYTTTYNKSATTMVIASIQILSSTSWSPFKVACGNTISQTEQLVMLTTEAAEI